VAGAEAGDDVRRIYACRLELDDGDERGHLVARAVTKRWVGAHHDGWPEDATRSEEHTSELQSLS
jgi:hypothetical protein